MSIIFGVDGCKNKWFVIEKDLDAQRYRFHLWTTSELFHSHPSPQVIAIDIPIGLPERGSRTCDTEARKLLTRRASSVFPAPIRPILEAKSRQEADRISRGLGDRGVSFQTFGILPKICQVDGELRRHPELQNRVWEIHPEVSCYFLAHGQPMRHYKKMSKGFLERYQVLSPIFGADLDRALTELRTFASKDDVLDAFAALWTAERIASGTFEMIPPSCPRDSLGLRMVISA